MSRKREDTLAEDLLTTAEMANASARIAIQQAIAEATTGKLKDPAGSARNMAVTAAVSIEKRNLLLDRPTSIALHADPRIEGMALLKKYGITIESTAEEIPTIPTTPPLPISPRGLSA